jgi:hypothetical protein
MQHAGEHLASHEPLRKVLEFCRDERIDSLDLEPVLEPLPVEKMWVHPLNMHPNAEVHAVAAKAIGRLLLERRELADEPR